MKPSILSGRIKPIRAAVEVTLIAVGVLAGLLAEAWLDSQGERRLEVEYLDALEQEAEANLTTLAALIDGHERIQREGDAMIQTHLNELTGASVPLHHFLDIFEFSPLRVMTATTDQLIASGDLSVIRSTALRTSVARWSAEAHAWSDYWDQEQWENWLSPSLPFLRQFVGSLEMYAAWNDRGFDGFDPDGELVVSERAADVMAERLTVIDDQLTMARILHARAEQVAEAVAAAR